MLVQESMYQLETPSQCVSGKFDHTMEILRLPVQQIDQDNLIGYRI